MIHVVPIGHYNSKNLIENLQKGYTYGRYIVSSVAKRDKIVLMAKDYDSIGLRDYVIEYENPSRIRGEDAHGVWLDIPDPELVAVREMEERELTAEIATKAILSDVKRRPLTPFYFPDSVDVYGEPGGSRSLGYDPKAVMTGMIRGYKSAVEEAKKDNLPNPYSTAIEALRRYYGQEVSPWASLTDRAAGERNAFSVLEAVVTQREDLYMMGGRQALIETAWPRGERPFIDYSMKAAGLRPKNWLHEQAARQKLEDEAGVSKNESELRSLKHKAEVEGRLASQA